HRPFPNWIVCNNDMAEIICPVKEDNNCWHLNITRHGSISTNYGNIQVWRDPLFQTGKALLGYKGEHPYDAGYIWAPYIMLNQTFPPNILCRYGRKLVDPTYFSTLTVKNLLK